MSDLIRIHTDHAPAAIGPYSQAIVVDNWVFCSGQIPLDPATAELVGGPVDEQTDQALQNLSSVLLDWPVKYFVNLNRNRVAFFLVGESKLSAVFLDSARSQGWW